MPSSVSEASTEPKRTSVAAGSDPLYFLALNETSPTTLDVNVGVCTNGLCGRYDSRSLRSIHDVESFATELLSAAERPMSPAAYE